MSYIPFRISQNIINIKTIMQLFQKQLQLAKDNDKYLYFIDSHTHLLDYGRESHLMLGEMLKECEENDVRYVIANACCTKEFKFMEDLYKGISLSSVTQNTQQSLKSQKQQHQHQQQTELSSQSQYSKVTIIPCFGIHPCYISQQLKAQNINNNWKQQLRQYLLNNPISQLGEIGLDFRKDVLQLNPMDIQWQYFQSQFHLSIQLNRSVTIHCVRAYGQLLKFLKKQNTRHSPPKHLQKFNSINNKPIIILHSYGGSREITKALNKLDNLEIYFSLSLKHSKEVLEVIPLGKLVVETDAPYQNDYKVVAEYGLCTKEELDKEEKVYNQTIKSNQPTLSLLKQCKFFNKSILNNRPKHVIANYHQLAKSYQLDLNTFIKTVTLNALKAFKLLK